MKISSTKLTETESYYKLILLLISLFLISKSKYGFQGIKNKKPTGILIKYSLLLQANLVCCHCSSICVIHQIQNLTFILTKMTLKKNKT